LKGGVRISSVTEIVGRAGVGKTQLCMQLAYAAAEKKYGTIYIDSEKKFSGARLKEIAAARIDNYYYNGTSGLARRSSIGGRDGNDMFYNDDAADGSDSQEMQQQQRTSMSSNGGDSDRSSFPHTATNTLYQQSLTPSQEGAEDRVSLADVLNNFEIQQINTVQELEDVINSLERIVVERQHASEQVQFQRGGGGGESHEKSSSASTSTSTTNTVDSCDTAMISSPLFPVRLIVIDSIAAPIKRELNRQTNMQERSLLIFRISSTLKRLADVHKVAIVVSNQVSVSGGVGGFIDLLGEQQQERKSRSSSTGDDDTVNMSYASSSSASATLQSLQTSTKANLGPGWHHCVNTRICLEHSIDPHRSDVGIRERTLASGTAAAAAAAMAMEVDDDSDGDFGDGGNTNAFAAAEGEQGRIRTATIEKSNVCRETQVQFIIDRRGVVDAP
jgi:RecA/RadA recombinase